MSPSLSALEQRRAQLTRQIALLGDFRRGSLSASFRRCGKPACACARDDHPGHGPQLRLSYKRDGKTVNQTLSSPASRRKAEREIAAFRQFQQLSRELVEVNEQICRLRPLEEEDAALSPQEKKRPQRSNKRSPRK
jgi:hypothetical protein